MNNIAEHHGVVAHYGEHLIDTVPAAGVDARLLKVRRGSPLLRRRRPTTMSTGRPVEWSDDRYVAGSANAQPPDVSSSASAPMPAQSYGSFSQPSGRTTRLLPEVRPRGPSAPVGHG
jgi:GntR family transcriptional regulator